MIPKCNATSSQSTLSSLEEATEENRTKNHTIQDLQSRLQYIHKLLTEPQIIHLRGFEFLQLKSVSHDIKQRVDTLFFEAHIPCSWKTNVQWNRPSHAKINVHITLLNYIVKERVKEQLVNYFNNNYNNIIYID
jgi:hypothetical protein